MKMVKSLLLGTAAGIVVAAGAQAADLPVKARPAQYVKICSLYGAGFYYIPGTDTCLKVGGYMRVESNVNEGGSGGNPNLWLDNRNEFFQDWRTRAAWSLDARSQTEFGTLRAFLFASATSDNSGTSNSFAPFPNDHGAPSGYVRLYAPAGFIQWAGFTFGKTDTFFDFDTMPYTNTTLFWGTNEGGNGQQVYAYTAQFGNGLSASFSIENASGARNGILNTTTGYGNAGLNQGYAQQSWPDFVANLRVDQSWGSAQIMGAIHDVTAADNLINLTHPSDATGWAIGGGVKVNLPMIGHGDYVITQVTYVDGALRYITGSNETGTFPTVLSGFPTITRAAIGPTFDAVVTGATAASAGSLDLTTGWAITGGFEHHWNPQWKTSLWGDYGEIRYNSNATAQLGLLSSNWSRWAIGSRTAWTPVENLTFSGEIKYNKMNGVDLGIPTVSNDVGWVSGMFRVQRNFYP